MQLKTFFYDKNHGWSTPSFPELDHANTLVLVFCDQSYKQFNEPLTQLKAFYKKSVVLGCSSAGEIIATKASKHTPHNYVKSQSITVAVMHFERTKIVATACLIASSEESSATGEAILNELKRDDLKGILILSEGLNINGSALVEGLNAKNDKEVVIIGGLAADGERFKSTWTMLNNKIEENMIVAVAFYGEHIKFGYSSKGGWDSFGPERLITNSKYNILYELDGQPALTVYKKYLGDRASGLPATGLLYPLSIRKDSGDNNELVRTLLGIDEEQQALIFAGNVPTGYLARLMYANFNRLIDGAHQASIQSNEIFKSSHTNNAPILAIAINCVGRRLILGEHCEEEIAVTLQPLSDLTQLIGFYSYGEISTNAFNTCDLHNQTMTLALISEAD